MKRSPTCLAALLAIKNTFAYTSDTRGTGDRKRDISQERIIQAGLRTAV